MRQDSQEANLYKSLLIQASLYKTLLTHASLCKTLAVTTEAMQRNWLYIQTLVNSDKSSEGCLFYEHYRDTKFPSPSTNMIGYAYSFNKMHDHTTE